MLAAMERVYRDGADVLNMSIGEHAQRLAAGPDRAGRVAPGRQGHRRRRRRRATTGLGALRRRRRRASGSGVIAAASVENLKRYRARASRSRPTTAGGPVRRRQRIRARFRPPARSSSRAPGRSTTEDDACAPLARRQPRGQGRARPPRHLQLHRQGHQRRGRGRGRRWSSTTTPDTDVGIADRARRPDPGRVHHPRRRRTDQRPARRGAGQPDVGRDVGVAEPDAPAWCLGLLGRRTRGRPVAEARHRRAGRLDPLDVAGREGRLRGAERHLDGLAARRRRGRAVPAGAPADARPRRRAPLLRTAPTRCRGRRPRPGARARRPPGRGAARHRRRDPGHDDDHPGQALAAATASVAASARRR